MHAYSPHTIPCSVHMFTHTIHSKLVPAVFLVMLCHQHTRIHCNSCLLYSLCPYTFLYPASLHPARCTPNLQAPPSQPSSAGGQASYSRCRTAQHASVTGAGKAQMQRQQLMQCQLQLQEPRLPCNCSLPAQRQQQQRGRCRCRKVLQAMGRRHQRRGLQEGCPGVAAAVAISLARDKILQHRTRSVG